MNKLTPARRAAVLSCLVDGTSIRATSRITGVAKGTILRLLESAGTVCAEYQDAILRNLPCRRIQADEIWSFVYGKDRNISPEVRDHAGSQVGSVWTWTALDAETKLMVSWYVGSRDDFSAREFVRDLASRLPRRIQLTTDGLRLYINAVEEAFGGDIDYAMLTKLYGASGNDHSPETRYSPGHVTGTETTYISGTPGEMPSTRPTSNGRGERHHPFASEFSCVRDAGVDTVARDRRIAAHDFFRRDVSCEIV